MARRMINAAGLKLIREFEGCKLTAYKDAVGVLTVGVGHTGSDVKAGQTITQAQAEALLQADLAWAEDAVTSHVKVPLTDNQFAALVSFTFNLGESALSGSTLLKKLNEGTYAAVPLELMKWVNAGGKRLSGLVRRRQAEGDLWNTKDAADPQTIVRTVPDAGPDPATQPTVNTAGLVAILTLAGGALAAFGQHIWSLFQ